MTGRLQLQRVASFNYGDGDKPSSGSLDTIHMLWIHGITEDLSRFLTGALGRANSSTYLMARATWLKNWWKKTAKADYLTFSYVQGKLDVSRRLGLGFASIATRSEAQERLEGLSEDAPLPLVQGFSLDYNTFLHFTEESITRKEFGELDKNHPAKTAVPKHAPSSAPGNAHGTTVLQTGSGPKPPAPNSISKSARAGRKRRPRVPGSMSSDSDSDQEAGSKEGLALTPASGSSSMATPSSSMSMASLAGASPAHSQSDLMPQRDLMTFFERLNDNNNKAAERMQHEQHVFLKEITTQMATTNTKVLSMMVGMTKEGKMQPQIDNGAAGGGGAEAAKETAAASADLNASASSDKFERLEDDEDASQAEMVDETFLPEEKWDHAT
eukprot:3939033-Rhodomonas_salina.1